MSMTTDLDLRMKKEGKGILNQDLIIDNNMGSMSKLQITALDLAMSRMDRKHITEQFRNNIQRRFSFQE